MGPRNSSLESQILKKNEAIIFGDLSWKVGYLSWNFGDSLENLEASPSYLACLHIALAQARDLSKTRWDLSISKNRNIISMFWDRELSKILERSRCETETSQKFPRALAAKPRALAKKLRDLQIHKNFQWNFSAALPTAISPLQ